jgi:hypothetical protein
MRALCGAIITAGALIGLGMAVLGFGTRYQGVALDRDSEGHVVHLKLSEMDRPLVFMLVFLTSAAIIGMGITFVGLAYHHHRRHHEHLHSLLPSSPGHPHGTSTTPGTHVTT